MKDLKREKEAELMKEKFKKWLENQKNKSTGKYLSSNKTIPNYIHALQNRAPKIQLSSGAKVKNLFCYTDYDEFIAIEKEIRIAPNYRKIVTPNYNHLSPAMKRYSKFLEEMNPRTQQTPKPIKNKKLGTLPLQVNEFKKWMRTQLKQDKAEPYGEKTIEAYAGALQNSAPKIRLSSKNKVRNLFYCTDHAEFILIQNEILNAPNFIEVRAATKNYSLPNGMKQYAKFLEETNQRTQEAPKSIESKKIDTASLQAEEFKKWMKTQKSKLTGDNFSSTAVSYYASALQDRAPKIQFSSGDKAKNLFYYTDYDEFVAIEKKIRKASNYREIINGKNGHLSPAMKQYTKFLKETNQHSPSKHIESNNIDTASLQTKLDPLDTTASTHATYTKDDFLKEVFLEEAQYDNIKNLLQKKKNLILQGAPGVGKTFVAQRLAYSIMGEKDNSRVKVIQFHQSYTYEDFVMGYRPNEQGLSLVTGVFYDFCKQATQDDRDYFFIIDDINRCNISKIFGELLMLIEKDKRGTEHEMHLLYQYENHEKHEPFYVPKNVYIIGMMSTADHSLAMIDYTVRRRFSFFELEPAFDSEGFIKYRKSVTNKNYSALINTVKKLNSAIGEYSSLGRGFYIGHSYFYSDDPSDINDDWIRSVIDHELVPLIQEYWFDNPKEVQKWSRKLRGIISKEVEEEEK